MMEHALTASHKRRQRRRLLAAVLLAAAVAVLFLTDIRLGTSTLGWGDIAAAVMLGPGGDSPASFIVWSLRLPMSVTCLFTGAALSLAGLSIQTVTHNSLASPYTLGVTAAASFAAALSITFQWTLWGSLWPATTLAAVTGALCVAGFILLLGRWKHCDSGTLILIGIIINFFFQALQQLTVYFASPEVGQIISHWTFGNLQRASWLSSAVAAGFWVAAFAVLSIFVWPLTALSTGDQRARSLGVPVLRLTLIVFTVSSVLVAGTVGFIGTVGFVGLVAPHCARLIFGDDQRILQITSSLTGAALMLLASIVAKLISEATVVPVGIITSVIGVPFLMYLLLRRHRA